MRVSARCEGVAQVVEIAGTARIDEYAELEATLLALVAPSCPDLVLDLSKLQFVGSAGLAAMVAAHNKATRLAGRVRIVKPQPAIAELLRISRLDRLFPIHDTLEDALRAVGERKN